MLIHRLIRRIIALCAPKNQLQRELFYLMRKRKSNQKTIKWCEKKLNNSIAYDDYEFFRCHLNMLREKWLRQIQQEYWLECKIVRQQYD